MNRIPLHNFGAGPCILPPEVLQQAAEAVQYWPPAQLSLLEVSHRHPAFLDVVAEAENLVRELLQVPENYHVLFLQGGASTQFGMIPQNFLQGKYKAAYLDTGFFAKKAMYDAAVYGMVDCVASSADENYNYVPLDYKIPADAAYFHITSNNTIEGTQMQEIPDSPLPLICDMSSDIFSKTIDVSRFGLIYAGAQKNMGPAGMTLVTVRKDLLEGDKPALTRMADYRVHAQAGSLYNTPPVFAIYTAMLNLRWLKAKGGVAVQEKENRAKASLLYRALNGQDFYLPFADKESRSVMNVTFHLADPAEEQALLDFALQRGITGIKGFPSMGGFRVSLYNAMPLQSVQLLTETLNEFALTHRLQAI